MILFLDTASAQGTASLCDEHKTIVSASLPHHDESGILPAIETMLAGQQKEYSDLDRIACVTGPGGFTTLRAGMMTANTLSYTLRIPIAGIHLSDLWRLRMKHDDIVRAKRDSPQQEIFWAHSTRRISLFIRSLTNDIYAEPTLIDLATAKNLDGYWIGELINEHKEILANLHPLTASQIAPLNQILPSALNSLLYEEKQIEPWYGREG